MYTSAFIDEENELTDIVLYRTVQISTMRMAAKICSWNDKFEKSRR